MKDIEWFADAHQKGAYCLGATQPVQELVGNIGSSQFRKNKDIGRNSFLGGKSATSDRLGDVKTRTAVVI